MTEDVLIRGESPFPPPFMLLTASIFFAFGLTVIMSMLFTSAHSYEVRANAARMRKQ
jgi:hypothetical protein